VALGLLATSGVPAAASPPRAAGDASLADQVRAMQALADRVGAELAAGAAAWEKGRAHVDVLIQQQMAAQRHFETQGQELQDAQARVNAVARRAYTHPAPETWSLALSVDPNALTLSLENIMILRRLGATRQDAVQQLVHQRVDGEARAARVERLRQQAQSEQVKLDVQLDALRTKSAAALADLQAAQAQLAKRRAEVAAARLAAAGRGPQPLGTCSTGADGSYANGFLPPEMLCPLATAPGQQLARQAAAAFDAMSQAHKDETGKYLCVTDSYRTYEQQVALFATKPSLAATPGRSQHGWGMAVDLCGGVERANTFESLWMQNNAPQFGFIHPDWAEPGGSRPEPWHWEFRG
jgi:hypothetical protein